MVFRWTYLLVLSSVNTIDNEGSETICGFSLTTLTLHAHLMVERECYLHIVGCGTLKKSGSSRGKAEELHLGCDEMKKMLVLD